MSFRSNPPENFAYQMSVIEVTFIMATFMSMFAAYAPLLSPGVGVLPRSPRAEGSSFLSALNRVSPVLDVRLLMCVDSGVQFASH